VTPKQIVRAGGLIGVTAAMAAPFTVRIRVTPEHERDSVQDTWVRAWASTLLRIFSVNVTVDAAQPNHNWSHRRGAPAKGRLVVSNHQSVMDIGVLLATFGGTMVSRADVAQWPVLGHAARAVGTIFVDRDSGGSRTATVRALHTHLSAGRSINLFPEGATFEGDEVRAFRTGSFAAAVRAEAEILPVGLAYPAASKAAFVEESFASHVGRLAGNGPTHMVLAVGTPIATRSNDQAAAVAQRAREEVQDLVRRARARCGP